MLLENLMFDIKEKFTLVITVHNDLTYIEDCLEYYGDFCNIIVADSSKELGLYSLGVRDNVQVIHEPGKLYYKKLRDVFSKVATPYMLDLSDDDIVFKEAILELVAKMEVDDAIVAADGYWLEESDGDSLTTEELFKRGFVEYSPDPDMITRTLTIMKNFNPPNHAIFRTEIVLSFFSYYCECPTLWPVRWWDKILAFMTCCAGQYMHVPIKYGRSGPGQRIMSDRTEVYPFELSRATPWDAIFDCPEELIPICHWLHVGSFKRVDDKEHDVIDIIRRFVYKSMMLVPNDRDIKRHHKLIWKSNWPDIPFNKDCVLYK